MKTMKSGLLLGALLLAAACTLPGETRLIEEDWSSAGHETLLTKLSPSPGIARAVLQPEGPASPDDQTLAGIMYRTGSGVEADLGKAAILLSAACEAGQMRGCREYANVVLERGGADPVPEAMKHFRAACDAGNALACADLTREYATGTHIKASAKRAGTFAEQACTLPGSDACANAGQALADIDFSEGVRLLAAACGANHLLACHWSGVRRLNEKHPSLHAVGLQHAEIACSGGFIYSCEALIFAKESGFGDSPVLEQAIQSVDDACVKGYAEGCLRLSMAYSDNGLKPIPADAEKTFHYSRLACEAGNADACRWTAGMYEHGKGTRQHIGKAAKIYRQLCESGDKRRCQDAARLDVAFSQPTKDRPVETRKAVVERACEIGDGEACRGIAWWHVFGHEGRKKDIALAEAHFIEGCDKGEPNACLDIGSLSDWAQYGFKEDKKAARAYYKRACELGQPIACDHYAQSKAAAR